MADQINVVVAELQPAALEQIRKATSGNDVTAALEIANRYGSIDGEHHKTWVIDQMVRALTGENYTAWVAEHKAGEDGPDSYYWEEGIAP